MMPPLVLIADDSDLNRKLAQDVLRAAGLETLEAVTGEAAIVLARRELPDLVLMDIRLPDLDGVEALRRLRAEPATAHIPVVALTALRDAREALLEAGFDDCLEKPIDTVAFPGQVRSFIGRPREAGTPGDREGSTLDDPHCA
jgi:CheY-like chemotaxis protein